jgi:cell wall-associated NlpC family hydrolase
MMKLTPYRTFAICLIGMSLVWTVSCSKPLDHPQMNASTGVISDQVVLTEQDGTSWVPVEDAVQSLGLRMQETRGDKTNIGYTDVMYEIQNNNRQAVSLGTPITLSKAPIRLKGHLYLTTESLSQLLQTQMRWDKNQRIITLGHLNDVHAMNQAPKQVYRSKGFQTLNTSIDRNALVDYARNFVGTTYRFGAGPYEETKTFDCSSFTQHVFQHFGLSLPRLAKDQGKSGITVNKNNLKVGDLILFSVPGRFKTNAIPGHVGIYMGNNKFIHTWGDPGVQISNLDSGHWAENTLFMVDVIK